MPTVSVIMPAFNAEPYLTASIESVLCQTFGDLELLIVDDGSRDATADVARDHARRDPRIRVLSKENAGPGPARNLGFRAASGRYFAFLDSDDAWDETFLAEHVAILRTRCDVDVVVGNARHRGGPDHGQPCRPLRGEGVPITLAEILADEGALFIMSVFRREAAEAVRGFDPAIFTNEEYDMWIRSALAGFAFTRHVPPLGWYTSRADSLSADDTRMVEGILRVYAKTRPHLPERSPERAIVDRQIARFEVQLAAERRKRRLFEAAPVVARAAVRVKRLIAGARPTHRAAIAR